jgi:hypothetical protein
MGTLSSSSLVLNMRSSSPLISTLTSSILERLSLFFWACSEVGGLAWERSLEGSLESLDSLAGTQRWSFWGSIVPPDKRIVILDMGISMRVEVFETFRHFTLVHALIMVFRAKIPRSIRFVVLSLVILVRLGEEAMQISWLRNRNHY